MSEHFITIGDKRVHYYQEGTKKETVILIHGWPVCGYMWTPVMHLLSERFRVIAVDLPGFGQSEPLNVTHSSDNYANFLKDFVTELNVPKVHLVGTSIGANYALLVAAYYPQVVRRIVVHCPPYWPKIFVHPWQRNIWLRYLLNHAPFLKPPLALLYRSSLYRWWYTHFKEKDIDINQKILEELWERSLSFTTRAADETTQELADINLSEKIKRVVSPTLVVIGSRDAQPVWVMEYLVKNILPNANLVIINGGTHRLAWVETKEFAKLVLNFLQDKNGNRK